MGEVRLNNRKGKEGPGGRQLRWVRSRTRLPKTLMSFWVALIQHSFQNGRPERHISQTTPEVWGAFLGRNTGKRRPNKKPRHSRGNRGKAGQKRWPQRSKEAGSSWKAGVTSVFPVPGTEPGTHSRLCKYLLDEQIKVFPSSKSFHIKERGPHSWGYLSTKSPLAEVFLGGMQTSNEGLRIDANF